jgi:hypothetical protein
VFGEFGTCTSVTLRTGLNGNVASSVQGDFLGRALERVDRSDGEIPEVHPEEPSFVVDWLKQDGFTCEAPRRSDLGAFASGCIERKSKKRLASRNSIEDPDKELEAGGGPDVQAACCRSVE